MLVALLLAVASPAAFGSASRAEYGGGGGGPLDLAVTVTATPAQVSPGGQATFRVRVNDVSLSPANDLIVAIKLPAGATVQLAQTDRGPGCKSDTNGGLSCNLDYLSSDSPVGNVTLVVTLPTQGLATLVATAAAQQHEDNTANNSAQTTVQVGTATTQGSGTPSGGTTTSTPAAPVVHVEHGTAGPDTIVGTSGPDVIQGGKGNDRLYGGAGNDRIVGGPGKDWIYGGPGNDTIYARDKTQDHVSCGSGIDTVYADKIDVIAKDCEKKFIK